LTAFSLCSSIGPPAACCFCRKTQICATAGGHSPELYFFRPNFPNATYRVGALSLTARPRTKGAKKWVFGVTKIKCWSWALKIALLEVLERKAKTLFRTILKFGRFGVKLDHFELNWAPNHPPLRSFLSCGRPSGFYHRRKLVGMPGVVPS
jgi:hypothetical protein